MFKGNSLSSRGTIPLKINVLGGLNMSSAALSISPAANFIEDVRAKGQRITDPVARSVFYAQAYGKLEERFSTTELLPDDSKRLREARTNIEEAIAKAVETSKLLREFENYFNLVTGVTFLPSLQFGSASDLVNRLSGQLDALGVDRSEDAVINYLKRFEQLPAGSLLFQITVTGKLYATGHGRVEEVSQDNPSFKETIYQFIEPGAVAHYFIGNPQTNADSPQNATFKTGVLSPRHAFSPHTHEARHFVRSEGFSGCLLFDPQHETTVPVKLVPGSMLYVPANLPHSFWNRSVQPLILSIADEGLGIENEGYAVTREIAQRRLQRLKSTDSPVELNRLMKQLEILERAFAEATQEEMGLSPNEKPAELLYQLAERLGMH